MDYFSISSLPSELWGEICHYLFVRDRFRFAISCKTAWDATALSGGWRRLLKGESENNKLRMYQYEAAEIMNRTSKPHIVLNALVGMGGNHLIWFHMLNDYSKCNLVVCNRNQINLIHGVINSLNCLKMYDDNPELSSILFYGKTGYKTHTEYIKQHFNKGTFHSGVRVIVCPVHLFKLHLDINNRFTRLVMLDLPGDISSDMRFANNKIIKSNFSSSIIFKYYKVYDAQISNNVTELIDLDSLFRMKKS